MQWNDAAAVIPIGALELPAGIVPASHAPLSATMRCVLPLVFLNVTVWPVGTDAGFGEKACAPELPTMVIVTPVVWGGVVTGGVVDGVEGYEPPQAGAAKHSDSTTAE